MFLWGGTYSQKPFQLDAVILFKILQPLGKALCARGGVGVVLAAFYAVHHPHAAALREHLGQIAGGFVRKGLEPDAHFRVQLCHGALPLCAAAAGFYGGVRLLIQLVVDVALAQQFSGEVISADSMQIYKGLDVGTAKVTPQETCGIPHHGVDILTPEKTFSVADFTALAGEYIQDITARGHLPLLVGGTGLYVQSLLYGVRFTAEKAPDGLREQLTAELEAIGPEAMYAKLQAVDPEAAAAIHPNNKVRVLRALEHYRATGKRLSEQKADSLPPERPYRSLVLGLDFPDRAALYRRIDLRVDKMLEAGLLAEAEYVWHNREAFRTAAQAIGYKEFFPYFEQTATLEVCTEKLKQASRNYAKRQLTWFRHMDGVTWLDAGAADMRQTALRLTQDFLLKG